MSSDGGFREGSGRKKGVPNKNKRELMERVNAKYPGWCPIEAMCEIACDKGKGEVYINEVHIRLAACKEVANYIYPKLRSMEHKGPDGDPLKSILVEYVDKTK